MGLSKASFNFSWIFSQLKIPPKVTHSSSNDKGSIISPTPAAAASAVTPSFPLQRHTAGPSLGFVQRLCCTTVFFCWFDGRCTKSASASSTHGIHAFIRRSWVRIQSQESSYFCGGLRICLPFLFWLHVFALLLFVVDSIVFYYVE